MHNALITVILFILYSKKPFVSINKAKIIALSGVISTPNGNFHHFLRDVYFFLAIYSFLCYNIR